VDRDAGRDGAMVDGRDSTGLAPADDARLNPAPPRPVPAASSRSKYCGTPGFSSGVLDYKPVTTIHVLKYTHGLGKLNSLSLSLSLRRVTSDWSQRPPSGPPTFPP